MPGDAVETDDIARQMAVFRQGWRTYRKVLDNNYMYHREVYGLLRSSLATAFPDHALRLLDVGCGDASVMAPALGGLRMEHYYGIDSSAPAIELAREALAGLDCTVTLQRADFATALAHWAEPLDAIWIGQCLHHLQSADKLIAMRQMRRVLGGRGLLLIWEPSHLESETHDDWMARFERNCRSFWSVMSQAEWDAMYDHCRDADYSETPADWLALGRAAGFADAEELLETPTQLSRVYRFGN
jgi:SAM-dependent methyltransferase